MPDLPRMAARGWRILVYQQCSNATGEHQTRIECIVWRADGWADAIAIAASRQCLVLLGFEPSCGRASQQNSRHAAAQGEAALETGIRCGAAIVCGQAGVGLRDGHGRVPLKTNTPALLHNFSPQPRFYSRAMGKAGLRVERMSKDGKRSGLEPRNQHRIGQALSAGICTNAMPLSKWPRVFAASRLGTLMISGAWR